MSSTNLYGRGDTQIPLWRKLLSDIKKDFEEDDLKDLISIYQKRYIPSSFDEDEHLEGKPIIDYFMDVFDHAEDELKTAQRMKEIFTEQNLHDHHGNCLADMVETFIKEETNFRDKFVEEVFLGRDDDVKQIFEALANQEEDIMGVHIWGIGGQGKSAVAKKVCLEHVKKDWEVIKVNMRDIKNIKEAYKALLVEAKQETSNNDDRRQLRELVKALITSRTRQTLFCLDDCDDIIFNDKTEFRKFFESAFEWSKTSRQFQNIITASNSLDPYVELCYLPYDIDLTLQKTAIGPLKNRFLQVCFLFTSRQKFEKDTLLSKTTTRFTRGQKNSLRELAEYQLLSLPESDAVELFKTCAEKDDITDVLVLEIVSACGCLPFAIKMASVLVQRNQFSPERLLAHLAFDQKNVSKALHMSDIIQKTMETLEPELQKALVKLSVFSKGQFDLKAAGRVLDIPVSESEVKESNEILNELHQLHLIESEKKLRASDDRIKDNKIYISLHPLVHRYLSEWKKPQVFEQAYNDAVRNFMDLYEDRINKIIRKLDTKSMKGLELLQKHTSHIMQFYDILHDKYDLLKPYPKETSSKHVLSAKRVSDLTDLLLSDVKKRRIFQSEADRARRNGSDAMYAFWMVEKADVLLMLHDKPDLALEILDDLTNGKYAALRGLHSHRFYPPLVHALFHKVKGNIMWKKGSCDEALKHLQLALQFLRRPPVQKVYNPFAARILCAIGKVYMDKSDLVKAEENFKKGFDMIMADMSKGKQMFSADNEDYFEKGCLQWDIPKYLEFFGKIKLQKAMHQKKGDKIRDELLDKAQQDLTRGMRLDEQLRMDNLDSYSMKRKLLADVYAEQGLLDEALTHAERALLHRREIIQPPHIKYVQSVYQVAKLYMLKGNEQQRNGDAEEAMNCWRTSFDFFGELKDHHLINGSILKENPLVAEIKSNHLEVTRLTTSNARHDLRKLTKFYKDLYDGCYDSTAATSFARFKEMLWTPMETLRNMFAGGGDEFGERDFILQREEEEAQEQHEEMMRNAGAGGVLRRKDSGVGYSSSDQGDSLSSVGSSISSNLGRMTLEKTPSMEDNVFTESTEVTTTVKPVKKRQRTIDE